MTPPATVGVLVMAHGTPATLDDLPAFYTEIRRGRPPSETQLADLERRYRAIGGTSPLNTITDAQARGIAAALDRRAPGAFRVRWGTRFCAPRIEEAAEALVAADAGDVVGLVLAPHSSQVSVAEYERRARAALGGTVLRMVDHWYDAPGFAPAVVRRVEDALASLPAGSRTGAVVVCTAHSVPAAVVRAGDTYAEQVRDSADAVSAAGLGRVEVAWQSAGRTDDEWLGPDVRDVIAREAAAGTPAVVVCPIGFVADHLEVLYDVDVEARAVADAAGIAFARTASFNADDDFCALVADVVLARRAERR